MEAMQYSQRKTVSEMCDKKYKSVFQGTYIKYPVLALKYILLFLESLGE